MILFKSTRERFYLIVFFLILLFCGGYIQLAMFLNQLKTSAEAGQKAAIINAEIKALEKEFWKLRFWEQNFHVQGSSDSEKQFEITIENIKKKLLTIDPKFFTERFSEKTVQLSNLIIKYKSIFNQLMIVETDRRLNITQIDSNYQVFTSTILMSDATHFIKSVRNLDKFLNTYLQNHRDSEYQAFRMIFELLKKNLSQTEIVDNRMQFYLTKLDESITQNFELEKKRREINKKFDDISIELTELFSELSQTAETLYRESVSVSEEVRVDLQKRFVISACFAFLLLFLTINMISRKIITPIRQISNIVNQFQEGDDQVRFSSKYKDEIAELGFSLNTMLNTINDHHYHLEELVKERTSQLNEKNKHLNLALKKVEEANKKIIESIQYAEKIQRSLLPNMATVRSFLPESFFIWMPKDIVGGDIFFAEAFEKGFVVAVIDCTGHGVPGAFMTMIASSGLRRIIRDEGCHDPAQILKRLNFIIKTTLQQDTEDATSDDGMDVAIASVRLRASKQDKTKLLTLLTFAGAKLPLICTHKNKLAVIKGDRQSIGYKQSKRSDIDFDFTNHTIRVQKGMGFYMATDGFEDQLGRKSKNGRHEVRRFGSKQFKTLIQKNSHLSFAKQRTMLLEAFYKHKGNEERQDDLTVVGFGF